MSEGGRLMPDWMEAEWRAKGLIPPEPVDTTVRLPDYITASVLDQWEASAKADIEAGDPWAVNPATLLAVLPVLRAALDGDDPA